MNAYSAFATRICAIALLALLAPAAGVSAEEQTFRFGVVPQFDARRTQTTWQPVLEFLDKQTGHHFELVGSPSIQEFEKQLLAGEFDFAYMNPYHLLKAHEAQGYMPLVRDVGRTLSGIVVVRNDSTIRDVKELDGMTVAFPAPNALGAALIPRREFGDVYRINIKPAYVRSHSSVYLNVVTGQTVAGGGVKKTLQAQPEHIRNALKIIYTTPQVAPHPVAVHPRVDAAVREKVREAFLQQDGTAQKSDLFARIPMKQAGLASLEDYAPLKQMGLERYYVQ